MAGRSGASFKPIVNLPDDPAPEEGALLFQWEFEELYAGGAFTDSAEFTLPLMRFLGRVAAGGLDCFVCDAVLDIATHPAVFAVLRTTRVANSAADPRRFSAARKLLSAEAPIPDRLVGMCAKCLRYDESALETLKRRKLADAKAVGTLDGEHHLPRFFGSTNPAGRA